MNNRAKMGVYGELISARYLRRHGYEILDVNYHSRFGEIDIIAQKQNMVVFVEVKTRQEGTLIPPKEAVTAAKQKKIKTTAMQYIETLPCDMDIRFDVIEVLIKTTGIKRAKIHHIENAFI